MEKENVLKLFVVFALFMLSVSLVVAADEREKENPNDWVADPVSKWDSYLAAGGDVSALWSDLGAQPTIRNDVLMKIKVGEGADLRMRQLMIGLDKDNFAELWSLKGSDDNYVIPRNEILTAVQETYKGASDTVAPEFLTRVNDAFTKVSVDSNTDSTTGAGLSEGYKFEVTDKALKAATSLTYDETRGGVVAKIDGRGLFAPVEKGVPKGATATRLRGDYTPSETKKGKGIGPSVLYERGGKSKVVALASDVPMKVSEIGDNWVAEVNGKDLEINFGKDGGQVMIGTKKGSLGTRVDDGSLDDVVSFNGGASVSLGVGTKDADGKHSDSVSVSSAVSGEPGTSAILFDGEGNLDVVGGVAKMKVNSDSSGWTSELEMDVGVDSDADKSTRVNLFGDENSKKGLFDGEDNVIAISRIKSGDDDRLEIKAKVNKDANMLLKSDRKFKDDKLSVKNSKGEDIDLGEYAEVGYLDIKGDNVHTTSVSREVSVDGSTSSTIKSTALTDEKVAALGDKLQPFKHTETDANGNVLELGQMKWNGMPVFTAGEKDANGETIDYYRDANGKYHPIPPVTSGPSSGNLNTGTSTGTTRRRGWYPGKYLLFGGRGGGWYPGKWIQRARSGGWYPGKGVVKAVRWIGRGIGRVFGWLFRWRLHLVLFQFLLFFKMSKFGLTKYPYLK